MRCDAAIRAVDGGAGVLMIVKNYTGDVLNFRLGADLARRAGHRVETVLVADDIALDDAERRRRGRRGGRRPARGRRHDRRREDLRSGSGSRALTWPRWRRWAAGSPPATRSIGVSVSGVTLPAGGVAAITLAAGEQEFGVGIHGEPGRERGAAQRADHLVARMCDALLAGGDPRAATSCSTRTGSAASPAWSCQRFTATPCATYETRVCAWPGRWLPRW